MHGARLRQRETAVQAEPLRSLVDGDDQLGIAVLGGDDAGAFFTSPRVRGEVACRRAATADG
jgi:hypothetical protein